MSGGGDLPYLNTNPAREAGRWTTLEAGEWERIEARVRQAVRVRDDFVQVPFPRVAAAADRQVVAATEAYQREAAIVDARLAREVALGLKASALSDVCERLRSESGIDLRAGPSVADEKVTLFCRKRPLREVMRQFSRPFGYAWLRSGKPGAYRYELVQDLKSQLLEEELRNRARNEALLALDSEMQRYRPYLALSPDEALARSKSAPEKKLLENLAGRGWGAIQMYFRISPRDLDRLRAGEGLDFVQEPFKENQQRLPPEIARGVLQSMREVRIRGDRGGEGGAVFGSAEQVPEGVPPASFPEARARVALKFGHSELGQFTFDGRGGVYVGTRITIGGGEYATGTSSAVRDPKNAAAHAALARHPALILRVSIRPEPSCRPDPSPPSAARQRKGGAPVAPAEPPGPKATSADVLEALHRATGLPIAADSYTRLFSVPSVSLQNVILFDALNQLADTMRFRWDRDKEGGWLQFRSVSYFDDRLKEVPNRLLFRWAESRREHGFLPLDHLIGIAGLTDIQLDSPTMAEGARSCFDLVEWSLARNDNTRPHLRYLATLTPAQREVALSTEGLPFTRLSLAQQQQLLAHLGTRLEWAHIRSLEQLSGAAVRVEYTQPGGFCWKIPEIKRREGERGPPSQLELLRGGMFGLSPVRERTREAALQAARRIDPGADVSQIAPTEMALGVVYMLTDPTTGGLHSMGVRGDGISTRIGW